MLIQYCSDLHLEFPVNKNISRQIQSSFKTLDLKKNSMNVSSSGVQAYEYQPLPETLYPLPAAKADPEHLAPSTRAGGASAGRDCEEILNRPNAARASGVSQVV